MILSKEDITSHELWCLSLAIAEQKEINQNNLEELLKLNLPMDGLENILRHKNSMDKTKEKALHKILFSDRKNFQNHKPLVEKEDYDLGTTTYHPFVTGKLLLDSALMKQNNTSSLLRDIYLHKNISEDTRNKMLNFYNGKDDTKGKKKLISIMRGIMTNSIITAPFTPKDVIVELIEFVMEKIKITFHTIPELNIFTTLLIRA